MNCYRFSELLSDYFENSLSIKDRKEADSHIKNCESCRALLSDVKGLVMASHDMKMVVCPANFDSRLKKRINEMSKRKKTDPSRPLMKFLKPVSAAAALLLLLSAAYISFDAYNPDLNPASRPAAAGTNEPAPDPVLQRKVLDLASQPLNADSTQKDDPAEPYKNRLQLVNEKK